MSEAMHKLKPPDRAKLFVLYNGMPINELELVEFLREFERFNLFAIAELQRILESVVELSTPRPFILEPKAGKRSKTEPWRKQ
jgi:hypothetical protein